MDFFTSDRAAVPHGRSEIAELWPTSDPKPVGLLEFLIQTYTRPGGVVLDNAMGIGSTGIAATNTGRRFIGIEKDAEFFLIAREVLAVSGRESA